MKGVCKLENGITVSQNTNTCDPAPDKLKFTNVNLYMKPENRQVERVTLMHRFINSCDSELTLEFANCAFILRHRIESS